MNRTGIRRWIDVMHVACPPDRTPTPTIPRLGGAALGRPARGTAREGAAR